MRPSPPLAGDRVLVAGGLGTIGSMLAIRLVELGAEVTVVDCLLPEGGGRLENIARVREHVRLVVDDIRAVADDVCRGVDVVFDLAGRTGHADSMLDPAGDLAVNCGVPLAILGACRRLAPEARIVFTSTRQVYGRPDWLPITENHPIRPVDFNGIHKSAAEGYHVLAHRLHGTATTVLRLTNVVGPTMRLIDGRQTFLGAWIRNPLDDVPIEVWGGEQRRDLLDVDDCVDALLLAATSPAAIGRIFNVGHESPIRLDELAALLVRLHGRGTWVKRDFPPERAAIDIGDACTDASAIRATLGWRRRMELEESLRRVLDHAGRSPQTDG